MRRTFQLWLFLCVAVAFAITFTLSFYFQTQQANSNALVLIHLKIHDAKEHVRANEQNVKWIHDVISRSTLAKVRTLAEMISIDPSILADQSRLDEIVVRLDVDEIHISDGEGILIAGSPVQFVGYDMASEEQSAEFMPAISDPAFEYIQTPRKRGADEDLFQYVGCARKDVPGIVQIGYFPHRYMLAQQATDIQNLAKGFRIGNLGQIIIGRDDVIVSIDDEQWLGKRLSEYGIAENLLSSTSGTFRCNLVHATPIESQPVEDTDTLRRQDDATDGENSFAPESGSAPEEASPGVLCCYEKFDDYTILGILPKNEMYFNRDNAIFEVVLFNLLLFSVVFVLVSRLVEQIVIRGIMRVNDSLAKITAGNLDAMVNVRTNAEFTSLSDGINTMVKALKDAIAETAARIDKELEFARDIQISSLPNLFPPFPDRDEFDLFATMDTAKEVGGDFYDFMLINNEKLGVFIADVSGKGIPAALFMMTSRATLKNFARTGVSPGSVFTQTNNRLCEDNSSGMFVTAFYGILQTTTGIFSCSSAGHNPPVIIRNNGPAEYLQCDGGIMLAGMEGIEYGQSDIPLFEGDRIYLYTDGVTEAFNINDELFGETRLLKVLDAPAARNLSLEELLRHVRQEVLDFTQGAVQSDDITMMILEFRKKGSLVARSPKING